MADTLWFVEECQFDGRWAAVTYRGARPDERGPEGTRRRFRYPPIEVNPSLHNLNLTALHAIYSPDGNLCVAEGQTNG